MKLSTEMIISYLVDVLGYDYQEAKDNAINNRITDYLSPEQFQECLRFNDRKTLDGFFGKF